MAARGACYPAGLSGGGDGAEDAVLAVLPERADLAEPGRAQRRDVLDQQHRLRAVVVLAEPALRALGGGPGQLRSRGRRFPPGLPVLLVLPAGKPTAGRALADR